MRKYRLKHTAQAFTLLELLTVIAIIVLLLGMLMPSLSKVRSSSVKMICHSNMRLFSTTGMTYLNDSSGFFPDPNEWLYSKASISPEHPIGCRWHDQAMSPDGKIMTEHPEYKGQMWEYIVSYRIPICPTFRRYAPSRGCANPNHNQQIHIKPMYSYTMNGYLGNARKGGVLKESQVRDAKKVFFFAEENSWTINSADGVFSRKVLPNPLSTSALDDTTLLIKPSPETGDCFATYHMGYSEDIDSGYSFVSFIDGHIDKIFFGDQLRNKLHGGESELGPAGNLHWAWADKQPPPGEWENQ